MKLNKIGQSIVLTLTLVLTIIVGLGILNIPAPEGIPDAFIDPVNREFKVTAVENDISHVIPIRNIKIKQVGVNSDKTVGRLRKGESYDVVNYYGDWALVQLNNGNNTGWIKTTELSYIGNGAVVKSSNATFRNDDYNIPQGTKVRKVISLEANWVKVRTIINNGKNSGEAFVWVYTPNVNPIYIDK